MKQCKNCVMNDTAREISFDYNGVCNFCNRAYLSLLEAQEEKKNLASKVAQIKKDGEGKEYDCLMGLSGGLDSSTTIDWAVKQGLRVLCFTLDNNYNTKEANHNIQRLVTKLDLEHKTIIIDQEKYTKLQNAFFMAGVRNCEIPTDHILMAVSLKLAKENDIKWILSGGNTVSESIMPESWGYQPRDLTHIKAIFNKFYPNETLDSLPTCSIWMWNEYKHTYGIQTFYPLDYLDYNLKEAKEYLKKEYDWQDYGAKHEESIFTGWFQNVFLPKRWGIDKRKAHLSSLIVAKQMTRDEALEVLSEPAKEFKFPVEALNEEDLFNYDKHEHSDYPMETWYEDIAEIIKSK
jgi:N-acetyl sugar amidotransferase